MIAAVLIGAFIVLVINTLAGEVLGWFPWCAERCISRAAGRLPYEARDRYLEEWLGELDALPGRELSKLVFGIRVLARAGRVRTALRGERSSHMRRTRAADILVSAPLMFLLLPLFALISLKIWAGRAGPVFVYQAKVVDGKVVDGGYRFRTMNMYADDDGFVHSTKFGVWLTRYSLDELPLLFDVLVGRRSLARSRPASST